MAVTTRSFCRVVSTNGFSHYQVTLDRVRAWCFMNMFHKRPGDVTRFQYEDDSGDEGEKAQSLPVSGLWPSWQMARGQGTVTRGIIGVRTERVWWGAPSALGGVRESVSQKESIVDWDDTWRLRLRPERRPRPLGSSREQGRPAGHRGGLTARAGGGAADREVGQLQAAGGERGEECGLHPGLQAGTGTWPRTGRRTP